MTKKSYTEEEIEKFIWLHPELYRCITGNNIEPSLLLRELKFHFNNDPNGILKSLRDIAKNHETFRKTTESALKEYVLHAVQNGGFAIITDDSEVKRLENLVHSNLTYYLTFMARSKSAPKGILNLAEGDGKDLIAEKMVTAAIVQNYLEYGELDDLTGKIFVIYEDFVKKKNHQILKKWRSNLFFNELLGIS